MIVKRLQEEVAKWKQLAQEAAEALELAAQDKWPRGHRWLLYRKAAEVAAKIKAALEAEK